MIYISTALYIEAKPFIEKYNLKKDINYEKFQVFKSNNITLIITGTLKIKAAIALSYLLSNKIINKNDVFINFGICGSINKNYPKGTLFLCNKIIDFETNKSYFPDIIIKHNFFEETIETHSNIIKNPSKLKGPLFDMEASGLYQCASLFFKLDKMFFIKSISDYLCDVSSTSLKEINYNINKNIEKVFIFIEFLNNNLTSKNTILNNSELEVLNTISTNMKFSETMKNELKQILLYNKLQNNNVLDLLKDYVTIQTKSKKEGKIYLEEFRRKFI